MSAKTPVGYQEFRTGLTFADVYYSIWSRRWKRRHGVLGAWREIKLAMYARYLEEFYDGQQDPQPEG